MRFSILGPLRLHDGEQEITVPAAKQRMLLAGLLLDAGRTQDAGRLTDIVWGDHPPPGERAALQMLVARLRRTVGSHTAQRIVTRPGGYLIEVKPDELDQDRFNELLSQGQQAAHRGQWDLALRLVADALSQWSGNALQDIPSERLQMDSVPRLEEARLSAIQLRIEARLALRLHENLLGELRELVSRYPLRERLAEQLIIALYQLGRRAEALAVYDQTRRRLVAELGIEPGAGLQALQHDILAGTEAGLSVTAAIQPAGPGQPAGLFPVPAQLPADIADFTGRAADLEALIRLLTVERTSSAVTVVLIIGAGGIGKTTMAVHAGHRLRQQFPDGQLYADLRGVSDSPLEPGDLLGRFLRGLGFGSSAIPRDDDERAAMYRSVLADRRMLVVLDNIRDSAQVLPLIPAGRGNAVLATSRAMLAGLDGAERIRLRTFGVGEATELFRRIVGSERVRAESGAATDVLAACAGLPLAVRIAAAHLAASPERTIAGLASRLASTGGRLNVLDEDGRGVRASIQASYATLTPVPGLPGGDPRRLFRLLGFWDGSVIGLPAATALVGMPASVTRQLADVLVERHLVETPAPGRYRLHDLTRAYALERAEQEETSDELALAMRRLGRWYLSRAHGAGLLIEPYRDELPVSPDARGTAPGFSSRDEALNWCDAERDNLIVATRQLSRLGMDDLAWQLPVTLTRYYNARKLWDDWIQTHQTGLGSARRCGDRYGEGRVLHSLGRAFTDLERFDEAVDAYGHALVLLAPASHLREHVWIMIGLASLHARQGAADTAIAVARDALALCGDADEHAMAVLLGLMGAILVELGHHAEGIEHLLRSLTIRRGRGDRVGQALTLHNLGHAYGRLRRYKEATESLLAALELRKDLDDRFGQANTLEELGIQLAGQGSLGAARQHGREALRIYEDLGAPEAAGVRAWLSRVG